MSNNTIRSFSGAARGLVSPFTSGILDTAGNVSPSVLGLGGDCHVQAQAKSIAPFLVSGY